jgi:hypothetical protein
VSTLVPLVSIVAGIALIVFRRRMAEQSDNWNRWVLGRWPWAKWYIGPKAMRASMIVHVMVGIAFILIGALGLLGVVRFK